MITHSDNDHVFLSILLGDVYKNFIILSDAEAVDKYNEGHATNCNQRQQWGGACDCGGKCHD